MQRLSQWFRNFLNRSGTRGRSLSRPKNQSWRPSLEALENRELLTTTIFLDFGEGFGGSLNMTANQLRNTIMGPNFVGDATATPGITAATNFRFDPLATVVANQNINFDGVGAAGDNADYLALRNRIIDIVRWEFSPFDVNVVVGNANSLNAVNTAMGANANQASGQFDAYVFITGVVRTDTNESLGADTGLLGRASGRDLNDERNSRDESVVVFADNFSGLPLDIAIANVASHEAGHTLGLVHTNATFDTLWAMMTDSDIMVEGGGSGNDLTNIGFFTRFSLVEGDGNTDAGVRRNAYDQLAADPDIGLAAGAPAFVTGTGAFDRITITWQSNTTATVLVEAYSNANLSSSTKHGYSYDINTTNGIIVDAGFRDDLIILDGRLPGATVYGGAGSDRLQINAPSGDSTVTVRDGLVTVDGRRFEFAELNGVIVNGNAGTKLRVDGSAATASQNITLKAGDVSGLLPANVAFSGIGSLTLLAGAMGNVITVLDTPQNPQGSTTVTIDSGWGSDRMYVEKLSSPLSVLSKNGQDTVTVGQPTGLGIFALNPYRFSTLANIRYTLGVSNELGSTELNLMGSEDDFDHNVTLGTAGDFGNYVLGLAPAPILWGYSGIRAVNMYMGDGRDTVSNIHARQMPMLIHTGGGEDTVSVASASAGLTVDLGRGRNFATVGTELGLDAIQSWVTIQATGGTTSLDIDDRAEQFAKKSTLNGSYYWRDDSAPIFFSDVNSLKIYGGRGEPDGLFVAGGNTFNIFNTLPLSEFGSYTTVYTGAGRDSVNVWGTTGKMGVDFGLGDLENLVIGSSDRGLDEVRESIYLFSGGPGLSVVVDDSGTRAAQTINIDGNSLRRTGAGEIDFGLADEFSLTVKGGVGGNVFNVQGKRGNLSLQAGAGNDVMNVGDAGGRLSNLGHFIINGQGGRDTLNLLDLGETAPQTYEFFSEQGIPVFTTQGTTVVLLAWENNAIKESETETVSLFAGRGADTITANRLVANARLIIDAGEGNDNVVGSPGRDLLIGGPGADQLDGGAEEDILIAGNTAFHSDPAGLSAIMAEWSRDLPYADRVDHVRRGGGLNGTIRLNLANYLADEGQNTLIGSSDLDLYYGSKVRDTHDWNEAIKEVFVDPDTSRDAVQIDATALAGSYLFMDYVAYNADELIHVELAPGQHFLYTYGSSMIYFTVAADGTIDYDPALEGILSGRGTASLKVNGLAVQIDATALSGSYLFLDYGTYEKAAPINVRLLPGESHFFYTYGSSAIYFSVDANGTVDYDAALDGFLSGRGTSALRVNGVTVQIDARALSGSYLFLDYGTYEKAAPISVTLLPGQSHFFYTYGSSAIYFSVDANGKVDYDAALEGVLSGKGTSALRVNGVSVQVDATALSGSYLFLDYGTYEKAAPISITLLPGESHFFYTYGSSAVYFTVDANGKLDYDPALEGILSGRGTSSLKVNGVAVQIDATALAGSYLFMDYATYEREAPISVTLLPGQSHFFYTYGSSAIYFSVDANGKVDYDSALEGILSGKGTSALQVNGVAVQIDATALSGSYLFLDYGTYEKAAPISVTLLPGESHFFYTYGGSPVYFTVHVDGTIDYDASLESFLSGKNTSTLTVDGWSITLDATALGESYVYLDYSAKDGTVSFDATLLPGKHFLYTITGKMYYFTITADGLIDYDPSLDGVLSGRGTRNLVIS